MIHDLVKNKIYYYLWKHKINEVNKELIKKISNCIHYQKVNNVYSIGIGNSTFTSNAYSITIGANATTSYSYSIAIGSY